MGHRLAMLGVLGTLLAMAWGQSVQAQGSTKPSVTTTLPLISPELQDRTRNALDRAAQARPNQSLPRVDFERPAGQPNSSLDPAQLAQQFAPKEKLKPGVLVFVSTSMPAASIERLAQDVRKVGGSLVIRGLLEHSLRTTINALQQYSRKGVQILIHPDAFKRHHITVVPSFVVDLAPDEPICADGNSCRLVSPVVEGDVSLAFALQRIEGSSTGSLKAQTAAWRNALTPRGN
jgi:type-F conjugative transfer system pilin assembly protein TrbC